jgi:hypothetical protein
MAAYITLTAPSSKAGGAAHALTDGFDPKELDRVAEAYIISDRVEQALLTSGNVQFVHVHVEATGVAKIGQ